MSRPAAWCVPRRTSSSGPPTSPRPTISTGASVDVSGGMPCIPERVAVAADGPGDLCGSDMPCYLLVLLPRDPALGGPSRPGAAHRPRLASRRQPPGCRKGLDGCHQRLLLRGPVELVQLYPAPSRPLLSSRRISQQVPDRPCEILGAPRLEEQQFVVGKVLPHRGDA